MAKRRSPKKGEVEAVGILIIFGVIIGVLGAVLTAFAALMTSPIFWILATFVAIIWIAISAYNFYWNKVFPNKYFKSDEFLDQRKKIANYVDECNELNDHIGELKDFQKSIHSKQNGVGLLSDKSNYKFQRKEWNERFSGDQVHNCSKTVITNAQNDPFKYLCKYFGIKTNETSLADFEAMLNDFSAADEGAICLTQKRDGLMQSIIDEIHPQIKRRHWSRLQSELGFDEVIFDQLAFPVYTFQYVSAGGNSSMSFDIEMNLENIEDFTCYLSKLVKFKKSVAGQRALMTKTLREFIKERDEHQCQECGISALNTENLLLEIDHIMPLSKGGITAEDNLQTLCWKCNRSKGSKLPS